MTDSQTGTEAINIKNQNLKVKILYKLIESDRESKELATFWKRRKKKLKKEERE